MPKLFDTIRLLEAIPAEGLPEGALGAIVDEFKDPEEAYEVEFVRPDGSTECQLALKPSQFVVLSREEIAKYLPPRSF